MRLFLVLALTLTSNGVAQLIDLEPHASSAGDVERGYLVVPLYRGAAVPFELTVMPTPGNCQGELRLRISWDKAKNRVDVRLTGPPGSLERFPDVDRTVGVNYFPNPFFPEPEDYKDGRYQLWLVSAAGPPVNFYFAGDTLNLLGSALDFNTPPGNSIPVPFPTLYLFGSPTFQPDARGAVDLEWSFPYNRAIRGDRPEYAHFYVTFPPPNLCLVNPFRLDLSTLRPYISDPVPASQAKSWADYLRGGLLFDVTIEPPSYYKEPPLTSLAATYSGATAVGGTLPRGWNLDIDAAFMGVAPPIRRWQGANRCQAEFVAHTPGINFCPAP